MGAERWQLESAVREEKQRVLCKCQNTCLEENDYRVLIADPKMQRWFKKLMESYHPWLRSVSTQETGSLEQDYSHLERWLAVHGVDQYKGVARVYGKFSHRWKGQGARRVQYVESQVYTVRIVLASVQFFNGFPAKHSRLCLRENSYHWGGGDSYHGGKS